VEGTRSPEKMDIVKKPLFEESPNASAKRMANFLKSSLILKQSPSPSSQSKTIRSSTSRKIVAKPLNTPKNKKVSPVEAGINYPKPQQDSLGQQVDKLCEELEKEIARLAGSKEVAADINDDSVDGILGMEIEPDPPRVSGNTLENPECNQCSDDDYVPANDDDYVPSGLEDDEDASEYDYHCQ